MNYQELRTLLLSKGGVSEDRSGHHIFFYIETDGRIYRATKFSHNARGQISGPILSAISQQMRLTTKELKRFVACTLEREQWMALWHQRGHTWRG